MKRTFTFLLASLFFMNAMKAAPTDLPQMTEDLENPVFYTISNTRSTSGKYLYYAGDDKGLKDSNTKSVASLFYFTGTTDAMYVHNAMTNNKLASVNSWTEEGTTWAVNVTPFGDKTSGLAFGPSDAPLGSSCWNEQNSADGFTTWDANDAGSIFVVEIVEDFNVFLAEAKDAAIAELEQLESVSVLYPTADETIAAVEAVTVESTTIPALEAAMAAVNQHVADYKNAAYQALEGKYYTINTPARGTGFMQMDGSQVIGVADASSLAAAWQFEYADGAVNVYNPYTGTYLCEPSDTNSENIAVTEDKSNAGAYQLVIFSGAEKEEAKVKFTSNGKSVHMASQSVLVRWNDGGASEWTVSEITVDVTAEIKALLEANAENHAENPALGQYTTAGYNALLEAKSSVTTLKEAAAAITAFEMTKNLPMFTIDSQKDYALGQSIYENEEGALKFKVTDTEDQSMLWAFDMTATEVGVTDKVVVRNVATGNLFWGANFVSVIETEPAVEGDGVFMFKTNGTGAPVHAQQAGATIVRWSSTDANVVGGASTWKFTYVGNTYKIEDLPVVNPNDYTSYIQNADLSKSYDEGETSADWDLTNSKGIKSGYARISGKVFDFSQTITLPAGQYKMTAKAAYRFGGSEQAEYDAIQAGDDTHLAKLYAATASYKYEVDVMNRYEGASDTDYAAGNGSVTVNGKFVPNSSDAVKAWFDADQYINELVFNVQEDGDVKIGIAKDVESSDYTNIGAWTLTRIGDAEADPEPEEVLVDFDMTGKVGTSQEAWNATGMSNAWDNGIGGMPEKYEGDANPTGDQLWQTVTGLENGTYTVELWANARVAWVSSPATDGQEGLTYLFANNVEKSIAVLLNPGTTGNTSHVLEGVEVTDGTLKMGMTKKAAGSNWHTIQIKSLTLHATPEVVLTFAKADLKAVIDTAGAVSPATEELTAAIAAAQEVHDNSSDKDEVVAATAALNAAIILANNTNAVADASEENPVLTTFVVNGTFDNGTAPWQSTTGATNQGTAINQQGAFTGNFFENWNGSNYTGKLYQVIENIPNGIYDLSICAFVETFDASAQFVYANGDKVALTTGAPTAYTVRTIVKDNKIEIGFEQTAAVNRWSGIDNISLSYLGVPTAEYLLDVAKEAFLAKYAQFEALTETLDYSWNAINENYLTVQGTALGVKDTIDNVTDVAVLENLMAEMDEVTTMLDELGSVAVDYNYFKGLLEEVVGFSTMVNEEECVAAVAALDQYGAMFGYTASSVEAVKVAVADLKASYIRFVSNAKPAEGTMFDMTFVLTNASFETGDLTGWTVRSTSADTGARENTGDYATNGTDGKYLFNSWWTGVYLTQEAEGLPNGDYRLTVAMSGGDAGNPGTAYIIANQDTLGINMPDKTVFVDHSVNFKVTDGKLHIATVGGNDDDTAENPVGSFTQDGYWWYKADNFRISFAGAEKPAEVEVTEVTLNTTWGELNEVGQTLQLTATVTPENATDATITWTSSHPEIATVVDGLVTVVAAAQEQVEIKATAANGVSVSCWLTVYVVEPGSVTGIKLNTTWKDLEVKSGDTFQLVATVEPADATDKTVTWTSSAKFATVDENGLVTFTGTPEDGGTVTITATASNGMTAQCMLSVTFVEDEDTAIDNIKADSETVIYDIHGRRVTEMTKGVYIVNGKKVVKK